MEPRPGAQTTWIRARRPVVDRPRDVSRPHAFLVEDERDEQGVLQPTLVVFLVNRECPWTCLECDLWKYTTTTRIPAGAIPDQIRFAQEATRAAGPARQIKLYNSGSFFDVGAIPPADDPEVARLVSRYDRVIVESHPALVGDRCWRFARSLGPRLEVAMGLETVYEPSMRRLNKRMTLGLYAEAAGLLRAHGVDLRSFLLIQPPFMPAEEVVTQTRLGVRFALEQGATVVSLIPTRVGNGALESLEMGEPFRMPQVGLIEEAFDAALDEASGRARVFLDTWDWGRFSNCPACMEARERRVKRMNAEQTWLPRVDCGCLSPERTGSS